MGVISTYVKGKLAASYEGAVQSATYVKAVISAAYAAAAEAIQALLADTLITRESGFLYTQDYIGDDYFEAEGYFANEERTF